MSLMEILELDKNQSRKRVGRGISAGGGKTAGRGTKGQNSRSGGKRNPGFEGGQNPYFQRLPKLKGFVSRRQKYIIVKTSQLKRLSSGKKVTNQVLHSAGIITNPGMRVKLLFDQNPSKPYDVEIASASKKAIKVVIDAGGSFKIVAPKLPISAKDKKS